MEACRPQASTGSARYSFHRTKIIFDLKEGQSEKYPSLFPSPRADKFAGLFMIIHLEGIMPVRLLLIWSYGGWRDFVKVMFY